MDEKDPCGSVYHCNVRTRVSSGCFDDRQAFRTVEQSWAEWLHRFYDEHALPGEEKAGREPELLFQSYQQQLLGDAENQSFLKFGSKISPVIEDDYRSEILPKIEDVITGHLAKFQDDEAYQDVVISSKPSAGKTEKIFHVYNRLTGEDLLRFHVRRDHPPQDGYWFNFHYHTAEDGFQSHHELGSIYWDRNTPPDWMSV